ncbi:MAG: hypothetical protein WD018_03005 [Nitrosopumilaceae archaeon]
MPDESCRGCGGMLIEYLVCADCREVVQFVCRICCQKTLERFHDGFCFTAKNQPDFTMIPLIMKSSARKSLFEK